MSATLLAYAAQSPACVPALHRRLYCSRSAVALLQLTKGFPSKDIRSPDRSVHPPTGHAYHYYWRPQLCSCPLVVLVTGDTAAFAIVVTSLRSCTLFGVRGTASSFSLPPLGRANKTPLTSRPIISTIWVPLVFLSVGRLSKLGLIYKIEQLTRFFLVGSVSKTSGRRTNFGLRRQLGYKLGDQTIN